MHSVDRDGFEEGGIFLLSARKREDDFTTHQVESGSCFKVATHESSRRLQCD